MTPAQHEDRDGRSEHEHGAKGDHASGHEQHEAQTVPGGYKLELLSESKLQSNSREDLQFAVVDPKGKRVHDFAVVHDKRVHLIIVRKDLTHFQHLHPDINEENGEITQPSVTFQAPGEYRMFADLTPQGAKNVVLRQDLAVGDVSEYQPESVVPDEKFTRTVDGTIVSLTTEPKQLKSGDQATLSFQLSDEKSGQPTADLEPYLGAFGHCVVLRAETLDYLHSHPMEEAAGHQEKTIDGRSKVNFHTAFEQPGRYRLFAQFQRNGRVLTAIFTVQVE